jgi:interferon-induced GTP-binding protein Mx1
MEEFSKCREFIEFLQSSGLDRIVELPEIAVLGDTSSGKSSVLTNISSIELPSAHDICTRCPTRIIMKNSKLVSFAVRVLWNDKSMAIFEYENVTARNITETISKAQSMILEKEKKEVSNSVVEVRVSGEEYMDLTLTDLPGIVRTVGVGESEDIIRDINSLITVALKNSKTIILAVHPANVDFHNSQILADARSNDPKTMRTLPIITKVDLVPEGSEVGTMELLLGKKT